MFLRMTRAIANAASNQVGPIAPGEIIAIYGDGLGPSSPAVAQLDDAGFDGDSPAARHGVARIHDQVDENLLDLACVRSYHAGYDAGQNDQLLGLAGLLVGLEGQIGRGEDVARRHHHQ